VRSYGVGDESGEVLEPGISRADVADELACHLLADGLDRARRADRDQDPGRTSSGQIGVRPTRRQVSSNACN
jgi:hypothetical protein